MRILPLFIILLMLNLPFQPLLAQQDSIKPSQDLQNYQSYIDDLIASKMEEFHIPGAVIAIVKDTKDRIVKLAANFAY